MVFRILVLLLFFGVGVHVWAQVGIAAKAAPNAIGSAGADASYGGTHLMWTVGEPVVFTGYGGSFVATNGFHQPMICKIIPEIIAYNETSCRLPYTLRVPEGYSRYQWKHENAIIANGRDFEYFPVRDGNYSVFVGDSTGCYLSATAQVDLSLRSLIPTITVYGSGAGSDTLLQSSPAYNYQWFVVGLDGRHRAIVGDTTPFYKPLYNGTYYVRINTQEHCISYSNFYTVNNPGFQDLSRYDFASTDSTIYIPKPSSVRDRRLHVYPVPCLGENFNVDYESPEKNTVLLKLYDVKGVVVSTQMVKNEKGVFHLDYQRNGLPVGKYTLHLVDGDTKLNTSVILE